MAEDTTTHRWPRFKLSTILVLVGITAWGMSCWPWWEIKFERITHEQWLYERSRMTEKPDLSHGVGIDPRDLRTRTYWRVIYPPDPRLTLPAATLVAFLTWKLGWAIAARWKRRREEAV